MGSEVQKYSDMVKEHQDKRLATKKKLHDFEEKKKEELAELQGR